MTRELEYIRADEADHIVPAARELCRHAMKPVTDAVCNRDKHCDQPLPSIQPIGCYHDNYDDRALSVYYANFRSQIVWTRMNLTVNQCAQVALDTKGI